MRTRPSILLFLLALAISCLPMTIAGAQTQQAQWGSQSSPNEREREREERHEERERERDREQRHEDRGRYEGRPGDPAQCNIQWDHCARGCNTIRDAYQREACVGACNNQLSACNSGR